MLAASRMASSTRPSCFGIPQLNSLGGSYRPPNSLYRLSQQYRTGGRCPPRRVRILQVRAIGFELPGDPTTSKSVEKQAEELTRLAASLLLYQGVLAGKPAQAFLSLLLHLQKGSPLKLLEHYGELYRALAADGKASWQDYLLDQIVRGGESPFAKAASKGEPTTHLLQGVAHDLDVLQQLAVTERTLANWVKDTAYGVSNRWLAAASSLAAPSGADGPTPVIQLQPQQQQQQQQQQGPSSETRGSPGNSAQHGAPTWAAQAHTWLLPPLSPEQRAVLMADIAGQWRWSEAAGLLQRYHAAHGYGLVSMHRILTWTGSSLAAQDVLKGAGSLDSLSLGVPRNSALLNRLERVAQELGRSTNSSGALTSGPPHHWSLCCDPLTRWQLCCALLGLLEAAAAEGKGPAFRAVIVPAGQLGSLAELAWALSLHPRTRFLVLLQAGDSLQPSALADLAAALSGYGGFSWPANATLVAGFGGDAPEALQPVLCNILKWGPPGEA